MCFSFIEQNTDRNEKRLSIVKPHFVIIFDMNIQLARELELAAFLTHIGLHNPIFLNIQTRCILSISFEFSVNLLRFGKLAKRSICTTKHNILLIICSEILLGRYI